MSESLIEREIERMVEPIAERIVARLLNEAARQTHAAAHADTDEARELRRVCSLEYLTKREAALFLNVSESHIDNLMADDATFPVHRVGGRTFG
jgi:hypothetical protein